MIFYWSHLLYIVFWIFLILHGPIFWYFFIIPGTMFVIEKIYSSKAFKLARYGKIKITDVNLLPSRVTHLVIERPKDFHFRCGDYIFINIPAVAEHEWHPFTISSAPEMQGSLWIHVRSAGYWTSKVFTFFDRYVPFDDNDQSQHLSRRRRGLVRTDTVLTNYAFDNDESAVIGMSYRNSVSDHMTAAEERRQRRTKHVAVEVFIDGPYGSSTSRIFDTEHAVLIGSGIGVTPFASILQSIMYRYNANRNQCPQCSQVWFDLTRCAVMKLRKVDFIWINRDQRCFEWFVSLLTNLEQQQSEISSEDEEEFLNMQMYMTSALSKNDMKGLALQLAMEMVYDKNKKDVVTGLRTRTQPGRPNWDEVFQDLNTRKRGKVKVFYCGAPMLGKVLKEKCAEYGFEFGKENY